MIEATIVDIGYGVSKAVKKALIGTRCSFCLNPYEQKQEYGWVSAIVEIVLTSRKNSRIRKERYSGIYLQEVSLADIVDDEYDLD